MKWGYVRHAESNLFNPFTKVISKSKFGGNFSGVNHNKISLQSWISNPNFILFQPSPLSHFGVRSMLVADVGDQMRWWQVWDVGDRFRMLVTDLIHWENHKHNEKRRQHNDSATNIWNKSPSESHQHHCHPLWPYRRAPTSTYTLACPWYDRPFQTNCTKIRIQNFSKSISQISITSRQLEKDASVRFGLLNSTKNILH